MKAIEILGIESSVVLDEKASATTQLSQPPHPERHQGLEIQDKCKIEDSMEDYGSS